MLPLRRLRGHGLLKLMSRYEVSTLSSRKGQKGRLRKIFNFAASSSFLLLAVVGMACKADADTPSGPPAAPEPVATETANLPGRVLTAGETMMAKEISSQFNTQAARVLLDQCQPENGMMFEGKTVHVCNPRHYSDDYSQENPGEWKVGAFRDGLAYIAKSDAIQKMDKGRALTAEELQFAQSVFGTDVNLKDVKLKNADCDYAAQVWSHRHKTIEFCAHDYVSPDYSREKDAFLYGLFMHEMTHVWQTETHASRIECKVYKYPLAEKYTFKDYCVEQQASIIEDYVRTFLHEGHTANNISNTEQNNALLKQLVETKFPAATKAREAFEQAAHPGRPLTAGEIAMAKKIAPQLDTSMIRITMKECAPGHTMHFFNATIEVCAEKHHSNDYSRENPKEWKVDAFRQGVSAIAQYQMNR